MSGKYLNTTEHQAWMQHEAAWLLAHNHEDLPPQPKQDDETFLCRHCPNLLTEYDHYYGDKMCEDCRLEFGD